MATIPERVVSVVVGWEEDPAVKWIKRIVVLLVVVFALFYLVTRPEDAAAAVKGAFTAIWSAFQALGRFFTSLAG